MPTHHIPYRPDDREISAGQRALRTDGAQYDRYFGQPQHEDKIVFEDGEVNDTLGLEVNDTLGLMERAIHTYLGDTAQIAQLLRKEGLADTIQSIWDFLYHNVQYKLDQQGLEQLRRPARSWADRHTGIDCDCFSIFCSSILVNLGIPHSLRVTRYSQPTWQHVYVVVPKDGKALAAGYYTIDAVLARADYEKPFTAKKDYKMSLTGINIAVLSGIDGDDNNISPTSVLMGFEDAVAVPIGTTVDANAPHYEAELYKFLLATRQTIAAAPESYAQATGGNPSDMVKMLDYAIQYWYTDKRDAALGQLEKNEEALNILNGFGAFNHVELTGFNEAELYGDDDAYEVAGLGRAKGKQQKPAKFFNAVSKAGKKGAAPKKKLNIGKALVRFNPATIAIRNGFLLALKLNIGKMSEKMKWAYATPQQAAAKRIAPAQVAASKGALAKVEKMFTRIGGKADNMRKAILNAKKGRLNGLGELGAVPLAAGLAAALPFIKTVMDVLKKAGLVKPGEQAELTPDGGESAETAVQLYTPPAADEGYAQESMPAPYEPEYMPAEVVSDESGESGMEGLGSIFGGFGNLFRGNPGLALALTAGGAYLLYNATKASSGQSPGLAGAAPAKRKRNATSKIPVYQLH